MHIRKQRQVGVLVAALLALAACGNKRPPLPHGPKRAHRTPPKAIAAPPVIEIDANGTHDGIANDNKLDSLCVKANQALREIELRVTEATTTLPATDAATEISRANKTVEYCFHNIALPRSAASEPKHLKLSVRALDWAGRMTEWDHFDGDCDVPQSAVVQGDAVSMRSSTLTTSMSVAPGRALAIQQAVRQ